MCGLLISNLLLSVSGRIICYWRIVWWRMAESQQSWIRDSMLHPFSRISALRARVEMDIISREELAEFLHGVRRMMHEQVEQALKKLETNSQVRYRANKIGNVTNKWHE